MKPSVSMKLFGWLQNSLAFASQVLLPSLGFCLLIRTRIDVNWGGGSRRGSSRCMSLEIGD